MPSQQLKAMLDDYGNAEEIVWVQEEPENMGAWDFIRPHLIEAAGDRAVRRVARPRSASPAEGSAVRHATNQQVLVDKAFGAAPGSGSQTAKKAKQDAALTSCEGMSARWKRENGRWKSVGLQALCFHLGVLTPKATCSGGVKKSLWL